MRKPRNRMSDCVWCGFDFCKCDDEVFEDDHIERREPVAPDDGYIQLLRDEEYPRALCLDRSVDPVRLRTEAEIRQAYTAAVADGIDVEPAHLEAALRLRAGLAHREAA